MRDVPSIFESIELYREHLFTIHSQVQAQRILNELWTGVLRYLAPFWGYPKPTGSKMTQLEKEVAKEVLKTLSTKRLQGLRKRLPEIFASQEVSQASNQVYRCRINQWLDWMEQQNWWMGGRSEKVLEQCCPPMKFKRGAPDKCFLTSRRKKHISYIITPQETSAALQNALDQFKEYLVSPIHPLRLHQATSETTAQFYLREIRLFLGFLLHVHNPTLPQDQLTLDLIVPKVSEDELDELTVKQQKKLWKTKKTTFDYLVASYFLFLREVMQSESPKTHSNKLCSVLALAKFQYASEVDQEEDYDQIPLIQAIKTKLNQAIDRAQDWQKARRTVSDFSKKWPDTAEGETALDVLRQKVVEPLRLECRPRSKRGDFIKGNVIAARHQCYLKWPFFTDIPAPRQQVPRDLKLTLSCPIQRPQEVPPDGFYHPLPPETHREKNNAGLIQDNYLYKSYQHNGEYYPEGVWIIDLKGYKTGKSIGPQSIKLPNPRFADGSCLYDYLERYLYGWWMEGGFKNRQVYDWWQSELKGKQGRWITSGRTEFNPAVYSSAADLKDPDWSWGYVFVQPHTGKRHTGTSFAASFEHSAYRLIGKRVGPHILRYAWATWAFQMELSDAQVQSLAYALGHSVETLRKLYERCTPPEKRRPIEKAIDRYFFQIPSQPFQANQKLDVNDLAREAQQLSQADRQKLLVILAGSLKEK